MKNFRLLRGVNNHDDVEQVDPLSFQFHGPKKALMYTVIKMIKPIPNEVLDRLTSPLAVTMRTLYYRYLKNEEQEARREIFIRVIPFLILLTAEEGDPNYSEVFTWMVYELWRELEDGNVDFPLDPLMPSNWWSDARQGRNWVEVTFDKKRTTNTIIPKMEAL